MARKDHPLKIWLQAQGKSVPQFAAESKIPMRTLYNQFSVNADPSVRTMLSIERRTMGAVTVQDQVWWFSRKSRK